VSAGAGSTAPCDCAVTPRVLVARSAMNAAATRKMLPTSSSRWKQDTSAWDCEMCAASWRWVRLVAIAVSRERGCRARGAVPLGPAA